MSNNVPALLAAAAGVGFGHAILPDHWVPLAVLGRTRRYPLARVARLSGLAGVAHVLVSIALGAGPCSVGELAREVSMEQSAVSQQLRVLRHLGLVVGERAGRQVIYALHDDHVRALLAEAVSHTEHLRLGEAASPAERAVAV